MPSNRGDDKEAFLAAAHPAWSAVSPADTIFTIPTFPNIPTIRPKALLARISLKRSRWQRREWNGHEVRFNIITNVENEVRKKVCALIVKT